MPEKYPDGRTIPLDLINFGDKETLQRVKLNDEAMTEYQERWALSKENKDGNPFADAGEKIALFFDGDQYWVGSGHHRLNAASAAGITSVRTGPGVELYDGTKDDAILFSIQCNRKFGVRLTLADRRLRVKTLLTLKPDYADTTVAKLVGCAPGTVAQIRLQKAGGSVEKIAAQVKQRDKAKKAAAKKQEEAEPAEKKPKKKTAPKHQEPKVSKPYTDELLAQIKRSNDLHKEALALLSKLAKVNDDFLDGLKDNEDGSYPEGSRLHHDSIQSSLNDILGEFKAWHKSVT